jgi:hypothetical protein
MTFCPKPRLVVDWQVLASLASICIHLLRMAPCRELQHLEYQQEQIVQATCKKDSSRHELNVIAHSHGGGAILDNAHLVQG